MSGKSSASRQASLLNFFQSGGKVSQAAVGKSRLSIDGVLKQNPSEETPSCLSGGLHPPNDRDAIGESGELWEGRKRDKRKRRRSLLFSSDEDEGRSTPAPPSPPAESTSSVECRELKGSRDIKRPRRPKLTFLDGDQEMYEEGDERLICKSSPRESDSSEEGQSRKSGRGAPSARQVEETGDAIARFTGFHELQHVPATADESDEAHEGSLTPASPSTLKSRTIPSILLAEASDDCPKNVSDGSGPKSEGEKDWHQWLMELPITSTSLYFREYADALIAAENTGIKKFPFWIMPKEIRDSEGRRPDDPLYDVSTVKIPSKSDKRARTADPKHFTPAMEQFWEVKQNHFDKIVCFKIGKFYELFYVDAFIAHRLCGLRWMGNDEKPHVGFPEVTLGSYADELVRQGFKVVVVEQMETPKELELRNKAQASKGIKCDRAVKRDIKQVVSIGTMMHQNTLPPESRSLLAIYFDKGKIGYAFCDVSTASFAVGITPDTPPPGKGNSSSQCTTNECISHLKTLTSQIVPVEVIVDRNNAPEEAFRLIKLLPCPPHINLVHVNAFLDATLFAEAWTAIGSGFRRNSAADATSSQILAGNEQIHQWMASQGEQHLALRLALSALVKYLASMLLKDKVLAFARFEKFDLYGDGSRTGTIADKLVLDAASLRHLMVLQGRDGSVKGSLLEYTNHTVSSVGFRLLKRWLAAPLRNPSLINERLDGVEWLVAHDKVVSHFRRAVSRLPDVERQLNKVTTSGLQSLRDAVYFEDVHAKHFAEYVELLDALNMIQRELTTIGENRPIPSRLETLCTLASVEREGLGMLQDVSLAVEEIKACLEKSVETQQWTIKAGVDQEFDSLNDHVEAIKGSLRSHLKGLIEATRKKHPDIDCKSVTYVHTKYPYEIEVPEKHPLRRVAKQMTQADAAMIDHVTSKRAGYVRFRTSEVLVLVEALENTKQQIKDSMYGCQQRLFQRFHTHYDACLILIAALAEVDVLASFAVAAAPGVNLNAAPTREVMCRPTFITHGSRNEKDDTRNFDPSSPPNPPKLRLVNSRHPLVANAMPPGSGEYIPNDIEMGGAGSATFLMVTGPNMGGKSTLLRQVCIAVIMAQIGAYVPASVCALTPVDRIFTRIGAYDSLLEGKSTFLVELEETAIALNHATRQSLAVFDELGRGTATQDGSAIAYTVAKYLSEDIGCLTLFSTHFQRIADELGSRFPHSIRNVHMAAALDEEKQSITFLYKLRGGPCPKSHGILVARLAGIDEQIVQGAMELAAKEQQRKSKLSRDDDKLLNDLLIEVAALLCGEGAASSSQLFAAWSKLYSRAKSILTI